MSRYEQMAYTILATHSRRGPARCDALLSASVMQYHDLSERKEFMQELYRKLADRMIQAGESDENVAVFEDVLQTLIPDFDPVRSWAESVGASDTAVRSLVNQVTDEEAWAGVSLNARRHAVWTLRRLGVELMNDPQSAVLQIAGSLNRFKGRYPAAQAWASFRQSTIETLERDGQHGLAQFFGFMSSTVA